MTAVEKELFNRISALLINHGTEAMRYEFDQIISPQDLPVMLQNKKNDLLKLGPSILTPPMRMILYPSAICYGESKDFDMSLLMVLFRNLCKLKAPPSTQNWKDLPTEHTLEADLVRLKLYRNGIFAHAKKCTIPQPEFEPLWRDISNVLLRRGIQQQTIDNQLIVPLSQKEEESVEQLRLQYLQEIEVKETLTRMIEEMQLSDADHKFTWGAVNITLKHNPSKSEKFGFFCSACVVPLAISFADLLIYSKDTVLYVLGKAFNKLNVLIRDAELNCIKLYLRLESFEDYKRLLFKKEVYELHRLISVTFEEEKEKLSLIYGQKIYIPWQHIVIELRTIEDVAISMENYAEIVDNITVQMGQTSLHLASQRGKTNAVKALLEAGANPNAVNNDGKTAQHYAEREGHRELVKFLEKGVEPLQWNYPGEFKGTKELKHQLPTCAQATKVADLTSVIPSRKLPKRKLQTSEGESSGKGKPTYTQATVLPKVTELTSSIPSRKLLKRKLQTSEGESSEKWQPTYTQATVPPKVTELTSSIPSEKLLKGKPPTSEGESAEKGI